MPARRDRLGFLDTYTNKDKEKIIPIFLDYQNDGSKINAIKKIRQLLNTGLVESKDLIECMEEYGVDEILKLKPPQYRFEKHRKINLKSTEGYPKLKLICPICEREPIDAVIIVTKSGERIGSFCRECYNYLTMPDTLLLIKKQIERLTEFVEHLQKK